VLLSERGDLEQCTTRIFDSVTRVMMEDPTPE
jgi:hypothetical protein